MVKVEVKEGSKDCQHSYARQDKQTIQILTRVCTRCGQEEVICDNEAIDIQTARKIAKKER